jgi:putative nucleotidyltransferase with HDIG domain
MTIIKVVKFKNAFLNTRMREMRKILFVNDDHKETKGLKKMLQPMRQEWEMEFAVSGEEALNFMSKSSFDAVISDMHLRRRGISRGMDGAELLGLVRELYPETVRIILSEPLDKEMALKSVKSAHQFLMKPSSVEIIKYTIERTCNLRDLLRNETLIKTVTRIKDLPSLPSLYSMIVKEMQSPDTSPKKVGYIISQDVSMSAKILQLVNSSFFGLPRKITDPKQAAVYLGINTLKALILSVDVFSSFTEDAELQGFSLADMRKRSIMVGRLAQDIARAQTNDRKVAEEAMIAGMLHDIGKLILLKVPRQYKKVMDFIEKSGCDQVEAEYTVMKTSHAEMGAYLLGLWGIPDIIVEAVAFHHNPSKLLENIFIMQNESSTEDLGKTKSKGVNLKPLSIEKQLSGFTILTAVHLADALLKQKDCSSDITAHTSIDRLYLRTLNLTDTDKFSGRAEHYNKVIREEVLG